MDFPLIIKSNFTDLLAERVDVLLQGDVLQQSVLQNGLQLLVDLEAELECHGGVRHLAAVQAGHDARAGPHLGLDIQMSRESQTDSRLAHLVNLALLRYEGSWLYLHVVGLDDPVLLLNISH